MLFAASTSHWTGRNLVQRNRNKPRACGFIVSIFTDLSHLLTLNGFPFFRMTLKGKATISQIVFVYIAAKTDFRFTIKLKKKEK